MPDVPPDALSERLEGIVNAVVLRAGALLIEASRGRARMTPATMDELRHVVEIGVRGAALEGARSVDSTYAALIPSHARARRDVQQLAVTVQRDTPEVTITTNYTRQKLPAGI